MECGFIAFQCAFCAFLSRKYLIIKAMRNESPVLLCNGTEAFPLILQEIENAKKHIVINMFIWRNDRIGKQIAEAVLRAADRGVEIDIIKDRYGTACEYMEEDQTSMFHPVLRTGELFQVRVLELLYHPDQFGKENFRQQNELRDRILSHPRIHCEIDRVRHDHSKFYVFDERVLVLGGINIEDKENGCDREGRYYRDYMVRLAGEDIVGRFHRRRNGEFSAESGMFAMNVKEPVRRFEIRERYLSLINESQQELTILMAYFAPIREFLEAITAAADRGVHVRILIPERANVTSDLNRMTMLKLFRHARKTGTDLHIYLSPYMTHTKALMNEKRIMFGSCNITRNAFVELDELNYEHPRDGSMFDRSMSESAETLIAQAKEVQTESDLAYNMFRALLERTVM